MVAPLIRGKSIIHRVRGAAAGGVCASARISTATDLTQLAGGGYQWGSTDWDDQADPDSGTFVWRYADLASGNALANDDAICFQIPIDGRYRLTWWADLFPAAGNDAAVPNVDSGLMQWWVDSANVYWSAQSIFGVGIATFWDTVAVQNTVRGGTNFTMVVPGFAGDIWIPESACVVGSAVDRIGPGAFASIEYLCSPAGGDEG